MYNLSKTELIAEILKVTDNYGFNETAMPGYLYVRVLYLLEDLEPFLSREEKKKIKRYGVQRGIEFLAGRPDPRGVPDTCYALYDSGIVILRKDEDGFFDIGMELDADEARRYVDSENRELGVSRAQESAMLAGALYGWGTESAFATSYHEDGTAKENSGTLWTPKVVGQGGNEQISM